MPKKKTETINLEERVMSLIRKGKIKMKPRWFFIIGSFLGFFGLVGASLTALFLLNLMLFYLRAKGPLVEWRLKLLLTEFPWWISFSAVVFLLLSIILLRRYDFSYKKNFMVIILLFISALFLSAYILDLSGLNKLVLERGPNHMKKIYRFVYPDLDEMQDMMEKMHNRRFRIGSR